MLEDCLLDEGKLPKDLLGIIDEYCGKDFDGTSVQLNGHTLIVNSVCSLGDGRLASGSDDVTIRVWDPNSLASGKLVPNENTSLASVKSGSVSRR